MFSTAIARRFAVIRRFPGSIDVFVTWIAAI
jgi:hypothetical protein